MPSNNVDIAAEDKAEKDAINMLNMKLGTPEQVSQVTGLPLEKVFELQKQVTVKA